LDQESPVRFAYQETIKDRIERETREQMDRGGTTFTSGFSFDRRKRQILIDAAVLQDIICKGVKPHFEVAEGPDKEAKIVDISFNGSRQILVTYDRDVEEPLVMRRECSLRE
jgi:hypothetical protein